MGLWIVLLNGQNSHFKFFKININASLNNKYRIIDRGTVRRKENDKVIFIISPERKTYSRLHILQTLIL